MVEVRIEPEWAVFTTEKDGVCEPGWWCWMNGLLFHQGGGGDTYQDADDLVWLGEVFEEPWNLMVEQLVVEGFLPYKGITTALIFHGAEVPEAWRFDAGLDEQATTKLMED